MPLYNYICPDHGEFDQFARLKDYQKPALCRCGQLSPRGLSAPHFTIDNVDYTCPITGKWIGSKAAHRDNLARHDCRVLETGEKEAAAAFRKAADDKLDKELDISVEKAIDAMPSEKKEQLHTELTRQNLDLSVDRL